jgi:peptidoglycan/LPS O-acetylase OafA/YrhL
VSDRPARAKLPFLPYLEGLRGVGALWVVLGHIYQSFEVKYAPFGPGTELLPFRGQFLLYGHYAVGIFMVVSGYVLTIPVAVRGSLTGGLWKFAERRARRLFPAYYGALTLAIPFYLFHLHQEGLHTTVGNVAAEYVMHALFIHQFFDRTIYGINGPLWSVGVEVVLYTLLVLLLLPVFRRAGLAATVSVALVLGFLPTIVGLIRHETAYPLQLACFWYLGEFAFGVAAAFIAYDAQDRFAALRAKVPWKSVFLVLATLFVILVIPYYDERTSRQVFPIFDIFMGFIAAVGFIAVAKDERMGKRSITAAIFSWKPLVWLGTFSYSLYLINHPIVDVVMTALAPMSSLVRVTVGYVVLLPAIVLIAYLFGRVFETPFVSVVRREADQALLHADAPAAVSSDAEKPALSPGSIPFGSS